MKEGPDGVETLEDVKAEIQRQLKLKSSIETVGPPYVILNGEKILKLLQGTGNDSK